MAVTINIDTGGTFTDGVFTRAGRAVGVKAFSTPHDLTIGMLECVDAGAEALGLDVEQMLAETTAFRFSSTIVTNALIERRGPRVGLLVSAGEERTLYGDGALIRGGYVDPELVAGVAEPLDDAAVTAAIEGLLDRGARVLAVSLRDSWRDPVGERALRRIVRDLYPTFYVGAVRVFLASDISALPGAEARTNTIVLNALVHAYLARSIYPAEEKLRRRGLRCPLLLVDGHAGLARAAKTLALQTHNSGPAAGVSGAAALADTLRAGAGAVITLDIGGTSSDVAVADARSLAIAWTRAIEGLRVHVPSVRVEALAYGGGTLARARDGALCLGPQSAGAHPGPACFDRGGEHATVSDANLLLGFLAADGFHGGQLRLVRDRAEAALGALAAELGSEPVALARRIRAGTARGIADGIGELLRARGATAAGATLVAYGGGGPLHAAEVAALAGIRHVVVPAMSSVFSALGVSRLDVHHVHPFAHDGVEAPAAALARLLETAARDVRAEGFEPSAALLDLDVVQRDTGELLWRHHGAAFGEGERALHEVLPQALAAARGSADTLLVLSARLPAVHAHEDADPLVTGGGDAARGERAVDWGDGARPTAILDCGALAPATAVPGPALLIGADQTIAVPAGWTLRRRHDGDFHLEAEE